LPPLTAWSRRASSHHPQRSRSVGLSQPINQIIRNTKSQKKITVFSNLNGTTGDREAYERPLKLFLLLHRHGLHGLCQNLPRLCLCFINSLRLYMFNNYLGVLHRTVRKSTVLQTGENIMEKQDVSILTREWRMRQNAGWLKPTYPWYCTRIPTRREPSVEKVGGRRASHNHLYDRCAMTIDQHSPIACFY
jgi:hypothetical protein